MERRDEGNDGREDDFALDAPGEASGDAFRVSSLDGGAGERVGLRVLGSARVRGLVVIGVALAVCIAVLLSLPGAREELQEVFGEETATPNTSVDFSSGAFYVSDGVPWTTLTADGKPIYLAGDLHSFTLRPGRHQLEFDSPPFSSLRCVISVPAESRDTCPLFNSQAVSGATSGVRTIPLELTPNALPAGPYEALVQNTASLLAGSTTSTMVQPSEHYLGPGGAAVADSPLQATLSFALNNDPARRNPTTFGPEAGNCVSFCAPAEAGNDWLLEAHILARWSFATENDTLIASGIADTTVQVWARWSENAWHVDLHPSEPLATNLCGDVFSGVEETIFTNTNGGYFVLASASRDPAHGCAISLAPQSSASSETPTSRDALLVIYHFGVILAGNDLTHQKLPQLPMASDDERASAIQSLNNVVVAGGVVLS